MSIDKLKHVTGWNQVQLAQFVGVKQPTIYSWLNGRSRPRGINRAVINVALVIASVSPDILKVTLDIAPPANPLARVCGFFGDMGGIHHWLDVNPYAMQDSSQSDAMGRLAVLLGVITALMPDVREKMVDAFPVVITRRQQERLTTLQARKDRTKQGRKRNADLDHAISDAFKDKDDPYP